MKKNTPETGHLKLTRNIWAKNQVDLNLLCEYKRQKIRQIIQQGHPFSFLSNFVYYMERSPTNHSFRQFKPADWSKPFRATGLGLVNSDVVNGHFVSRRQCEEIEKNDLAEC